MRIFLLYILIGFSCAFSSHAQTQVEAKTEGEQADLIDPNQVRGLWKISLQDVPGCTDPDFDDSSWISDSSELRMSEIRRLGFKCFGVFRYHLHFDSLDNLKPKVIRFIQAGATEIYVNGIRTLEVGKVSCDPTIEVRESEPYEPIYLPYEKSGNYVIVVKFSNTNCQRSFNVNDVVMAGFKMLLNNAANYSADMSHDFLTRSILGMCLFIFFITVGALHLLLFIYYHVKTTNLYFALFCFSFSFYFYYIFAIERLIIGVDTKYFFDLGLLFDVPVMFLLLMAVLYSFFYERFPKQFWILAVVIVINVILIFAYKQLGVLLLAFVILTFVIEATRVIIVAFLKKKSGALYIMLGFSFFLLFFIMCFVIAIVNKGLNISDSTVTGNILNKLLLLGILSIPCSMSAMLAWDFSRTNRSLGKKLIEVEELSARTIEQEKEKQKILAEQNEVLEVQVEERTREINEQKKVIEEKNKDITDSINYAQRIQHSILPTVQEIQGIFSNSFVLFKPRDIVSGDFYQFKKNGELRYAILADCTGHGVPGALMSMIGSNLLKQIILERGTKEPHKILRELHKEVRSTLRQAGGIQSHDGMDAAIVLHDGKKLFIASANRPVYIVKKGELTELKPDKRSIGGSSVGDDVTFTLNELEIESGMMIYLFSDGYADQFGGPDGKKFKVKNLSQLLVSISEKPLEQQKQILNSTFDDWKMDLEQVDDVSLIGLRF